MHIEGRRWFERLNGNTYHSVRIYKDGECIAFLPYQYGYGDQYVWTACEWLAANGHIPEDAKHGGPYYLRTELHASISVIDVSRKKDL